MITFVFGTAAPEESDTNPTMEPTSFCANTGTDKNIEMENTSAAQKQDTPAPIIRMALG
jgi:hypothetical protein